MKEESVNLGVCNNNSKEGPSCCLSLSMVVALAAIFILRYVIEMRLDVTSVSRVLVTWQYVFVWCTFASVYMTLLAGQPNCVAAQVVVLVTVPTVRGCAGHSINCTWLCWSQYQLPAIMLYSNMAKFQVEM
jgi:hypothetical protein